MRWLRNGCLIHNNAETENQEPHEDKVKEWRASASSGDHGAPSGIGEMNPAKTLASAVPVSACAAIRERTQGVMALS